MRRPDGETSAPTSAARSPTCVCVGDDGRVRVHEGALDAARLRPRGRRRRRELAGRRRRSSVVHGTTVATNAVLERRGARTALVTTAGLPRRARAAAHAHAAPLRLLLDEAAAARRAPPALRGRRAHGAPTARSLQPLDDDEARALAARLRERRRRVGRGLPAARAPPSRRTSSGSARSCARSCPGVPVSLSSEILREQQEYERTATTVVNAYVRPLMERYVDELRGGLDAAASRRRSRSCSRRAA